jgi:protein-tyrosine-phosphatase/predicted ATP-grasp superfamily ATP-dependent carboligase
MKSDHQPRVLVLDADMVPALTISRSLSRRHCLIDLAGHTPRPLSSFSNTVNSFIQYPDPLSATDQFVEWLSEFGSRKDYDLVIPVTERTLVPISGGRDRLQHVKIAMPAAHSLEVALDKSRTLALAERLGVPGPVGVSVAALDELVALQKTLRYPVVIKPARSLSSGKGGASHLQVSYAFEAAELEAGCAHALRFGPVLLQEFFPGQGVGIELIARQGRIAYAFQHLRLHEVPLTGGGSSLRKSQPVMPELLAASERLIAALEWNGVAMVEFKLDPLSREFCLMEINGRFWGSLPLAVAAGADFPSMLLDLELDGEIRPSRSYRNDVYCRLLSRDVHWYEAVLREGTATPMVKIPSRWEIFKELRLFFNFRHRFDVQSMHDPVPGLVDLGRILGSYLQRILALAQERRFFSRQQMAWQRGEVPAAVSRARSILFLCYGNINRSALADVMVRAYAKDAGIAVASAGFHQEAGRPADPVMVDVARRFGIDMNGIRSTCVTERMLHENDIIFVMEKSHYDRLLTIDASVADKVYLLGAHQRGPACPVEIEDPYGHSRENYVVCYERIADAVDVIKTVIAVESGDQGGDQFS